MKLARFQTTRTKLTGLARDASARLTASLYMLEADDPDSPEANDFREALIHFHQAAEVLANAQPSKRHP